MKFLELALGNPNSGSDRPWQCDEAICWLKLEEVLGTVTWYSDSWARDRPCIIECAGFEWEDACISK